MYHTLRLQDGTIGTITDSSIDFQSPDFLIGEIVTVSLHDENGNNVVIEGRCVEIL